MTDNVLKDTPILKADDDLRIVYGVVLEPDSEDLQGDIIDSDTIEKAAHAYLRESRVVGDSHMVQAEAEVVESYIAPADLQMGEQTVRKGSWIMAVKVHDDELWAAVKKGEMTGFSIGGFGTRSAVEKAAKMCKCPECGALHEPDSE
jgi:hypothetical protein